MMFESNYHAWVERDRPFHAIQSRGRRGPSGADRNCVNRTNTLMGANALRGASSLRRRIAIGHAIP
jgi:hypothetical protein